MKAVTAKELKLELENRTPKELRDLCLRLARFKKENKELLTYLLFEADDEAGYAASVKAEMDQQFELVNRKTKYLTKKGVRRILTIVKKYIRYSLKKETEVDLLVYFCAKLKNMSPPIQRNNSLLKLYLRQMALIRSKLPLLHEDLQYDYKLELEKLVERTPGT